MSRVDQEAFQDMQNAYRNMPYNVGRLTATLDALAMAEQLDASLRASVLYDLAWAYALGDDPAKALPVCAEFLTLLEECPAYQQRRIEAPSAAMIAAYVSLSLPQIPLEQCRALLQEFYRQVKQYGLGERVWQVHACGFCLDIDDTEAAEAHLQRFYQTQRDEISDCEACEAGNVAECLLGLGRRQEAMRALQPVLDGSLTCEDQPWSSLAMLIHDGMDRGDLEGAKALGQRLARKKLDRKGDLPYVGALLRLRAWNCPERWISLLEKGLRWSVGVWDQRLLFGFYQGAWIFCARLSEKEATLPLSLPKKFDGWREDGQYDTTALARWLYGQTVEIAHRFDRRNGSSRFGKQIPPFALPEACGAKKEVRL